MNSIFSTAYFPSAIQYSEYLKADKIIIEAFEHFPKQTFRNRTSIMTAGGVFDLSVPLDKRKNHQLTKDIKINYAEDWQTWHWRTIKTAYQKSPFLEFYEDPIKSLFFDKKFDYLLDFNLNIENQIDSILKTTIHRNISKEFLQNYDKDFRNIISPKNSELKHNIQQGNYYQVYSDRIAFEKNLSILDIIFNLGPESVSHLKAMKLILNDQQI